MEECDLSETMETIDELHDSILSLCDEDNEPNKMSDIIKLPLLDNKQLSCLQTPLSLAGLSPIVSKSATPRLSLHTPNLKRKVRHFSSTPCVGPYQPKRLALNESEQTMMTISEIGEQTFEVSKIKIDNLYKEAVDIHDKNYFKDALNTSLSVEAARFSLVNYSKNDETIVLAEDENAELTADILGLEKYIVLDTASQEEDDMLDLTVSDDEDTIISCKNSTIIEESKELGSTTVFGAETIPVKSSILLGEETIAVNNTTLKGHFQNEKKRKLEDDIDVKPSLDAIKEGFTSFSNSKRLKSVSDDIDGLIVPKTTTACSTEDESIVEVIYVEESIEVIDISDDSVAGDITVTEKTSDLGDAKPTPVSSTIVATAPSCAKPTPVSSTIVATAPSRAKPTPVSSTIVATAPSCAKPTPVSSTIVATAPSRAKPTPVSSTIVATAPSRPQPSVSPNQPPYTLNEKDLMNLVKSNWGTAPVHDVNNNLTSCSYRNKNKQTPNEHKSILEGNFRIPPLLRSNINKNDLQIKGQGKTPTEIANSINKQLNNMDNDCQNKILCIEANKRIRSEELKQFHKGQIQMLRQRQIVEMREASLQLQLDPMNYWSQCHKLQLYTDHDNQKDALQYQHVVEMRELLNEIEGEKQILYEQAEKSKNNLTQIKEKLEAATNQNPVDPDMVHTTIDVYKGPCRSNSQKQSVVQVCLPADIASYMIREEEMYNMNYKYRK